MQLVYKAVIVYNVAEQLKTHRDRSDPWGTPVPIVKRLELTFTRILVVRETLSKTL